MLFRSGAVEYEFLDTAGEENRPDQISGQENSLEGYQFSIREIHPGDRFFVMTDAFRLPITAMGHGDDVAARWFTTLLQSTKNIGESIDALMQHMLSDPLGQGLNDDFTIAGVEVRNQAMAAKGGIDLNSDNLDLQIKRDGKGVPLPLQFQDMEKLRGIEGFVPVIINIVPVVSLPFLSELQQRSGQSSMARATAEYY